MERRFIKNFGGNQEFREAVLHPMQRSDYTQQDREFFAEAYAGWVTKAERVPKKIRDWFDAEAKRRKKAYKP